MPDTTKAVERVLAAIAAEAKRIAAEGVASPADIDTAMRFGALFRKPPFEYIKEIGEEEFEKRAAAAGQT